MENHGMEWDASLGVWKGERAAATSQNWTSPLYIFGYGSLLWRPGDLLENLPSFTCTAFGYTRLFAQRSCDHRGTPEFPGVVATLVETGELQKILRDSPSMHLLTEHCETSECPGLVWLVPDDVASSLLAELDYRERGGYCRHEISIRFHERTPFHQRDDTATALVYTGSTANPLFDLIPHHVLQTQEVTAIDEKGCTNFVHKRFALADIIAASVGPSGPNPAYLFGLAMFIREKEMHDRYIECLAFEVQLRLGPWRGQWSNALLTGNTTSRAERHQSLSNPTGRDLCNHYDSSIERLIGWGSNESGQLTNWAGGSQARPQEQLERFAVTCGDPQRSCRRWRNRRTYKFLGCDGKSVHFPQTQVIAGGKWSGVLSREGLLFVWGTGVIQRFHELEKEYRHYFEIIIDGCPDNNGSSADGEEEMIVVTGVHGCAAGHDHFLLLLANGFILGIGDNSRGQCRPGNANILPLPFLPLEPSENGKLTDKLENKRVVKLAAGLHHSAAITEDGYLYTWGEKRNGQCLVDGVWRPPDGARLIDVACGAMHTAVIDDLGHLWTFGRNRHGALGRNVAPQADGSSNKQKRSDLDQNPGKVYFPDGADRTRWQRVVCGWSHTVVRGLRPSGEIVTAGFGRNDMGQYMSVRASRENVCGPSLLSKLPTSDGVIREIWCGSEFTIAADLNGRLFSCGWNDHGSLGCGSTSDSCNAWMPVVHAADPSLSQPASYQVQLAVVWEGGVVCGGAHALCARCL